MEFLWNVKTARFLLFSFIFSALISISEEGANEKRLLDDLFHRRQHNRLERPVADETKALVVHFGLVLQQIIDVEEKNEVISTNLWLNLAWNDYNMGWNESDFGGIKTLRIPASTVWKPDILMYNSADEDIDSTFPTNVVLSSSGDCLWVPPGLFRSTCKMDITWFPFDDQICSLKFGSWSYDSRGIDLRLQTTNGGGGEGGGGGGDLSSFIPNGEWMLIEMPAERNVKRYECCPEEYIDVTFRIHIRRRTLYYGFNLIIPCVLISSMALLTFTLPPDAGEKISLGVTILLSLTVFLLLVAETMPPTSDAVPLIGMYFASIMLMCSLSVVFTVLVLNCHYRTPDTHQMPPWVRKGICEWLGTVLFVQKQGNSRPRNRRHFLSRDARSVGLSPSRSLLSKEEEQEEEEEGEEEEGDHQVKINRNTADHMTSPFVAMTTPGSASAAAAERNRKTAARGQMRKSQSSMYPPSAACVASNSSSSSSKSQSFPVFSSHVTAAEDADWRTALENGKAAEGSRDQNHSRRKPEVAEHVTTGRSSVSSKRRAASLCDNRKSISSSSTAAHNSRRSSKGHRGQRSAVMTSEAVRCLSLRRRSVVLLTDIAEELRFLTDGIKAEDKKEEECNEWKYAAMVIDRLCLILFTCFTFISTVAILFSAPHTVV